MGFGVWGSSFGVWVLGFGFWVLGLGFGVWGFEVWSLEFGVWGLRFGVWGFGGSKVRGCLVVVLALGVSEPKLFLEPALDRAPHPRHLIFKV